MSLGHRKSWCGVISYRVPVTGSTCEWVSQASDARRPLLVGPRHGRESFERRSTRAWVPRKAPLTSTKRNPKVTRTIHFTWLSYGLPEARESWWWGVPIMKVTVMIWMVSANGYLTCPVVGSPNVWSRTALLYPIYHFVRNKYYWAQPFVMFSLFPA